MLSQLASLLGGGVSAAAWLLSITGSGAEQVNACALASDGGIILAGQTASEGAGGADAWLAKVSTGGAIEWQRRLGGTGSLDTFYGVTVDGSGNIYAVGYTNSAGTGGDGLICKYNSSGTIQWQERWGYSTGADFFYTPDCDSSGNVYVAARVGSGPAGSTDFAILKFNSSGVNQWVRFVGGTSTEASGGGSLVIDGSDNIYFAADTSSTGGAGLADTLIGKFNTAGTIQWQRSLGGAADESGNGIAADASGNIYVVGRTASTGGAGSNDVLLCKYNASGTIQWQRSIGGANYDTGVAITVGSDGYVYLVGYSDPASSSVYDILVCKYDASGTIQWQRTLGTSVADTGTGIIVDAAGYFCVVGYTGSTADGIVARLPTDGSKTGTYGSWTYAASSKTDQSRSLTDQVRSLTVNTSSGGEAATSLTEAAASRTTSLTEIA